MLEVAVCILDCMCSIVVFLFLVAPLSTVIWCGPKLWVHDM